MGRYLLIITLLSGILLSCGETKNSSTTNTANLTTDTLLFDLFATKVIKKNNIGVLHMVSEGDTLILVSDRDLTWMPFGVETKLDSIKKKYLSLFMEKDTIEIDPVSGNKLTGIALTSSLSNIFFKHQKTEGTGLCYATIMDTISIAYGLKVGMSKNEFFNRIFGQYDSLLLRNVNVVDNGDPLGEEMDIYFSFEDGVLKAIKIRS